MQLWKQVNEALEALWQKYQPVVEKVKEALAKRSAYAHYPEIPSGKIYGEDAKSNGLNAYQKQLNNTFERLLQEYDTFVESDEVSPYTGEALKIRYPAFKDIESYIERSENAMRQWQHVPPHQRAGLLIEALEKIKENFFEITYATMHTTGQGFMMAFQASGPHASDRALEAIVMGYEQLTLFPESTLWEKDMGKQGVVRLRKFYRPVPKGIALVIGCSTFPIWNAMPGIFANLITGNAVIVKPHPRAIYPLALVVSILQQTFKDYGIDPHLIQLAPDKVENPITKLLAEHPKIKIIDFTGSSAFGNFLEQLQGKGKVVFTEKSGVNSVIIDSVADLDAVMKNLAFSVSLYSGQMCTCPQNFFIPEQVKVGEEVVDRQTIIQAFLKAIEGLTKHPKAGPAVLGAIQNEQTKARIEEAKRMGAKVLLESMPIQNPEFPNARTATPLVLEVQPDAYEQYSKELFGPIVLIIPVKTTEEAVQKVKQLVQEHGAIACAVYTTDEEKMQWIAWELAEVAAPVAFNLTGPIYMNQNAAFSDIHVTGGNPAGNASFTDTAFISRRFSWTEFKVMA